jgi:hypothetical protein
MEKAKYKFLELPLLSKWVNQKSYHILGTFKGKYHYEKPQIYKCGDNTHILTRIPVWPVQKKYWS